MAPLSDVFEEVEERLREDKWTAFFRKYGWMLAAGALAFVASFGLYEGYQAWQRDRSGKAAETFTAAQEKFAAGDFAGVASDLTAFEKNAPAGYRPLSAMLRAGALQAQGDLRGALAAFDQAANVASDPLIKASAQLRGAYIAAEVEDFARLEARLKPLIDGGGPFSYQARELLGVEAWEANQLEKARAEFSYLSNALDAPEGVRQSAQRYGLMLGPPASAPAAPAKDAKTEKTAEAKSGDKK